MANLQTRRIDENFYKQIKQLASENRFISREVLHQIKLYLSNKKTIKSDQPPAQSLLNLSGSWENDQTAEEIIKNLRLSGKNSKKLVNGF